MGLGETTIDLNSLAYYVQLGTGLLDGNGHIAPHKDKEVSDNKFSF